MKARHHLAKVRITLDSFPKRGEGSSNGLATARDHRGAEAPDADGGEVID
jgi:hypothetical protein